LMIVLDFKEVTVCNHERVERVYKPFMSGTGEHWCFQCQTCLELVAVDGKMWIKQDGDRPDKRFVEIESPKNQELF